MSDDSEPLVHHIVEINLDERTIGRCTPEIEHERKVAIFDLLEENQFALLNGRESPYRLNLKVRESRLVVQINSMDDESLEQIIVQLTPFRAIIKDYFTICESYFEAIKHATPSQIETLDMGRRSLHDEGSEMLRERLAKKVDVDFNTSRRLFTLLCVLHLRG